LQNMFDPRDLDDLIAIWQSGSLSAAAKRRGVAVSTISRRIETLEAVLKLRLIDRQAKGTLLTAHGMAIARMAEPMAEQIARVNRLAHVLRRDGGAMPVRLSATEHVISDVLAPELHRLWARGVHFPLHLQSQGDIISLAGRDADLAIRMSRPEGASLIARKLPPLRLALFASKDFLSGRDPSDVDLRQVPLLVYDDSYGRLPELDWLDRQGLQAAVALRTGSTRALTTAAMAGAGVAMLAAPIAARSPELVEIPVRDPLPVRTPWLLVHRDLQRQPSVRLVHRWVVEVFTALAKPRGAASS
jgi:DNA-binding transcriptional LysR family regulator